jgi:hypothetical protein
LLYFWVGLIDAERAFEVERSRVYFISNQVGTSGMMTDWLTGGLCASFVCCHNKIKQNKAQEWREVVAAQWAAL